MLSIITFIYATTAHTTVLFILHYSFDTPFLLFVALAGSFLLESYNISSYFSTPLYGNCSCFPFV